MPNHVLSWSDHGLVTVDLEDDRSVVLVFDSEEQAVAIGQAVALQAGREVFVAEIDAPDDGIAAALEVLLGMSGSETQVVAAFPGDALFEDIVGQLR